MPWEANQPVKIVREHLMYESHNQLSRIKYKKTKTTVTTKKTKNDESRKEQIKEKNIIVITNTTHKTRQ